MLRPRYLLALLVLLMFGQALAQPVRTEQAEAELIAQTTQFQAGDAVNWVALRLRPDPGWHVYWQNPGDSGIPTSLEWTLPDGVSAGPIHWPYPHAEALGELTNYGYSLETLHLVPVRIADVGQVNLQAKAKWLVCKDICIPEEADLTLSREVVAGSVDADLAWKPAFESAHRQIPQPASDWRVEYQITDDTFSVSIAGAELAQGSELALFPLANDLVSHAAPQRIAFDADGDVRLSQQLSTYFETPPEPLEAVLVAGHGQSARAWQLTAQAGSVNVVPAPSKAAPEMRAGPEATARSAGSAATTSSLPLMLLFALIGGLILNLMPCVFPVLAIKALSVAKAGEHQASERQRQALAYTAGVIVTFVAIAALLIGLRAGGEALGWGFQLQSPGFVLLLTSVIFAMGLSLSGVAQFGVSWMGAGQGLASRSGASGSFFTGALAVVVATPCTAPFMAPALGFALVQPTFTALVIFAALGLGLALPFLLIGFVPGLASWLPRPGAWMETFKQLMAWPMYLTAVWLLWVLGGLTSRDGMALGLIVLMLVAIAVWLFGRGRSGKAQGLALMSLILAIVVAMHPGLKPGTAASATPIGWEPYSDERLASLRGEGRSVFVDFTADWCLTCKLNERGAMRSERVRDAFRRHDVALLVGDWTRRDDEITAVLDRYGRSGVPLYLVSREGSEPVVLPQVLTPEIIVSAFE